MPVPGRKALIAMMASAALACGGCGSGKGPGQSAKKIDQPAKPPPGWRTVANRPAGFTIAAPRRWMVRVKDGATLLRSPDRLLVVTVAADRTPPGRQLPISQYARETLQDLPDFDGSLSARTGRVRGSPYRSAVVEGAGTIRTSRRVQRITVAALRVPGQVTYTVAAFRSANLAREFGAGTLRRMLRTLRSGVPG
jgi:hypothetical protein